MRADHGAALGGRLGLARAAVDERDAEALLQRSHGLRHADCVTPSDSAAWENDPRSTTAQSAAS